MLTRSLNRQIRQIETELNHTRQAEVIEKRRFKKDLKAKLEQPTSIMIGLAGAAALGYLITPAGDDDAHAGSADARINTNGGAPRHPWLEKLVDSGVTLAKAYIVASMAERVVDE